MLFGDANDGINIYARALVQHGRTKDDRGPVEHVESGRWRGDDCDIVHVNLSDRLVADAAAHWHDLVDWVQRRGRLLAVTLHDLPQIAEGADRRRRRSIRFRDIAAVADVVLVSSESERMTARSLGIAASVVAHPIFPTRAGSTPDRTPLPPDPTPTIVVAGFVHPGKGVAQLLESVGDVRGTALDGWQLRLVGAATDQHAHEPKQLEHAARANGLDFHHTGPVSQSRWDREMVRATVAVCPHLHCSASGSILSWIAHGRRPLTAALPFSQELVSERPGAVTIVHDPGDWLGAIVTAATAEPIAIDERRRWRTPRQSVAQLDLAVLGELQSGPRPSCRRTA